MSTTASTNFTVSVTQNTSTSSGRTATVNINVTPSDARVTSTVSLSQDKAADQPLFYIEWDNAEFGTYTNANSNKNGGTVHYNVIQQSSTGNVTTKYQGNSYPQQSKPQSGKIILNVHPGVGNATDIYLQVNFIGAYLKEEDDSYGSVHNLVLTQKESYEAAGTFYGYVGDGSNVFVMDMSNWKSGSEVVKSGQDQVQVWVNTTDIPTGGTISIPFQLGYWASGSTYIGTGSLIGSIVLFKGDKNQLSSLGFYTNEINA